MSGFWKEICIMALKLVIKVLEMVLKADLDGDGVV